MWSAAAAPARRDAGAALPRGENTALASGPTIRGENTMAVTAEVLLCVGYAVLALAYLLHVLGS